MPRQEPACAQAGQQAASRSTATHGLARVRLGIIADIHGNDVALRAVLNDAGRLAVDRWWALGDLALFGPRSAEVLRLQLPAGVTILGVHASPRADDGPGIEPGIADEQLRPLLAGCGADVVVGGHTHVATDRLIDDIHILNPGSVGLPRTCGTASWLLLEAGGDAPAVTHRHVPFDVEAVVTDLHRRRHPNAEFTASVLTGQRQQRRTPLYDAVPA